MRIADRFKQPGPVFSFEFFPPKTPEAVAHLYATAKELAALRPSFVSVTYGAGGSTRELTVDLVTRIKREIGLETMAHLTCVGQSADEIAQVLDRLARSGIENVLTLRGDPPRGETQFVKPEGGFGYAQDLTRFIKPRYNFCLGGAAYPETHIEAASAEDDLRHLREKVDAGVDFLITQLFFEPADYFRFVERARAVGITVPIVPGILPVSTAGQLDPTGFVARCGAKIPASLRDLVDRMGQDEDAVRALGVEWASDECRLLLAGGAPGIHFYTLNRAYSARMVFANLHGSATTARA